jgi:hypothetical protein
VGRRFRVALRRECVTDDFDRSMIAASWKLAYAASLVQIDRELPAIIG